MKSKGKQSLEIAGETVGDSREQVRRYIHLTELIPPALDLVDSGKLAMRSAVELSYLPPEQQQSLAEAIDSEESVPSHAQAAKLRQFSDNKRLDNNVILSILQEEAPLPVEQFKIPKHSISRFFAPHTPAEKIQETIIKALELLRQQEQAGGTKP
jgi:ParB family chromosome partitioning protein